MKIPAKINPMLCTLVAKPFADPDWIFENKWDGERAIVFFDGKKVRLQSRIYKDLTFRYPEIVEDLKVSMQNTKNYILDGEIVALDKSGRSDFETLQQRIGLIDRQEIKEQMLSNPVYFMVFDTLFLDGKSLMSLPLTKRKEIFKKVFKASEHVKNSPEFSDGIKLFGLSTKLKLEGIVAKKKNSPYVEGERGKNWLKIKNVYEQEVIVCGWTQGIGARSDTFGALILGVYEKGKIVFVGSVGSGFNNEDLIKIKKVLLKVETNKMPYDVKPKIHEVPHWINPEIVIEIKFANWTNKGILRVPIFIGMRPDKKARDVVRELPKPYEKI